MANQENFASDVTSAEEPRLLASRIINSETEQALFEIIPASVGYELGDNIELHFYSYPANNLYLSTVIRATEDDVLKSHIVSYEDGTFRNYIRIDFTRLFVKNNISLIPGNYRVTINFFYDEIGSYDNRKLYVDKISNTRTEVQLAYFDPRNTQRTIQNINEVREFILPSFPQAVAIGVAEKIFRSGVGLQDNTEGLTYDNILDNLDIFKVNLTEEDVVVLSSLTERLENEQISETEFNDSIKELAFKYTIDRVTRLSPQTQQDLETSVNDFVVSLYSKLRNKIVIEGDKRIQEDEFREFIQDMVNSEFDSLNAVFSDPRILIT